MEGLGFVIFGILPYAVLGLSLGGTAWRLWRWWAAPAPWRALLTPALETKGGVARRLALPAL